jgi:phage terminase large subunit-like protein
MSMDDKTRAAIKTATSLDWQQDAMTFLGVMTEAGKATALAAQDLGNPLAEATALYRAARDEAQITALLGVTTAVRELATVLEDMRRMIP